MIVLAAVVGYLLGSFPSADLVARIASKGAVDIRRNGSGNPGTLNAARVLGKWWGVVVFVLDLAKGIAAGLAGFALARDVGAYVGATAAVGGHIFPVWSRFRGGKGVATSAGACLAVFPAFFPIDLVASLFGTLVSRRAERGTQIACAIWVTSAALWWAFDWPNLWGPEPGPGLLAFAVVGSGMILWAFADARRRGAE